MAMDSQSTPKFPKGERDEVVEEMTLTQKIHGLYKGTVEKVMKHRTVSTFKEKGVLSVNEFVLAGVLVVGDNIHEAAGGEYLVDDEDEWVATHGNPKGRGWRSSGKGHWRLGVLKVFKMRVDGG
ncbi:Autophagy-related protein 3 [Acorus calamus]|uniref:Autophagy-related protein 3 n=1 Tax=Acorus calamus TaxID=4465 RepID=A0AAV9CAS4_ACOCL|nr:Autophagy-related protein 3 [Acorus calamus]